MKQERYPWLLLDADTACSKQSNSRPPPSSLVALCMDYVWKKVLKFCRRKPWVCVCCSNESGCKHAIGQTYSLLLIKVATGLYKGYAKIKYCLPSGICTDKQRLSMLWEQTQLVMLSLILKHFWVKLSDPLSSSKADISRADMCSREGISRLTRRPDKASFHH